MFCGRNVIPHGALNVFFSLKLQSQSSCLKHISTLTVGDSHTYSPGLHHDYKSQPFTSAKTLARVLYDKDGSQKNNNSFCDFSSRVHR